MLQKKYVIFVVIKLYLIVIVSVAFSGPNLLIIFETYLGGFINTFTEEG